MERNEYQEADQDFQSRSVPLIRKEGPFTIEEKSRSVRIVLATEAPVRVYDWDHGEIDEVLPMEGLTEIPNQVPLLDCHSRGSVSDVLGSMRDFKIVGDELECGAFFSEVEEADKAFRKVKEGHVTDASVGYRVLKATYLEEEEEREIFGKSYQGPLKVALEWVVREGSMCPIGADERAKARQLNKEKIMDEDKKDQGTEPSTTGQAGERTVDPPATTPAVAPVVAVAGQVAPPVDENKIRQEARQAERQRSADIQTIAGRHDCIELATSAIEKGVSVEEFRAQVLDHIGSRRETSSPDFQVGQEDGEKFRNAMQDGLSLRCGLKVETPAGGSDELRGYTLSEMARELLKRSGNRIPADRREMMGRALTTSDFPILLSNTMHKSLMEGYQSADEQWRVWCGVSPVSDFKIHEKARASETDDLDEIQEMGEYQYGDRSEAKETYKAVTYGKLMGVSRQMLINDDLGALNDIPKQHGEAVSRKIGDVAFAIPVANPNMGDGTALFHANHGNLLTAAALDETSLGLAIKGMKLQKDIKGKRRLNIRPEYILAPVSLEQVHETFFSSQFLAGTAKHQVNNIYSGRYTRIYEPRLDDDSLTAWYLAGPKGKTVMVVFLDGREDPYMETKQGWNVDGVEYKVRIDCGAYAADWRAMQKNPGA